MSINALKNIHGLDVSVGLTNCMNDEELYLQVVDMFHMQLNDDISTIQKLYTEQNWEELGKACHGIKGAAASVGAVDVQDFSETIEIAGKNGDSERINSAFDKYISALNNLREELCQK